MRFIVRPAAAADIDEAYLWYESQGVGLGNEFLAAAQAVVDAIAEDPLKHPVVHRNTRRTLLKRFPYALYYRVYDDVVVVVACMHGRRSPSRWQSRT
jgi:plasmid stabilization system protein ParE